MEKSIKEMTKKELIKLDNFIKERTFDSIVIVPMNYKHDSGYQCMKYILLKRFKIVAVIGGASDVIHINGFGGFGKNPNYDNPYIKRHELRIDCLPGSKCVRLFSDELMELDSMFCGSDFVFYFNEEK